MSDATATTVGGTSMDRYWLHPTQKPVVLMSASAAGHSLREIAMATGMAYATVGRIINAEKAGES